MLDFLIRLSLCPISFMSSQVALANLIPRPIIFNPDAKDDSNGTGDAAKQDFR